MCSAWCSPWVQPTVGVQGDDVTRTEDLDAQGVVVEVGPHGQHSVLRRVAVELVQQALLVVQVHQTLRVHAVVLQPLVHLQHPNITIQSLSSVG